MAQAAGNLEVWDCGLVSRHCTDTYTVAGAAFERISACTVCFRRPVQRVARWSCTGIARDSPLLIGFRLLFSASNPFVGRETRGYTQVNRFRKFASFYRITERRAKKSHGISPACAR